MKQFSNRYIFVFSTVMVVLVATLLSLSATLLKPAQERNLEIEKKRNMLESVNIPSNRENAIDLYKKYINGGIVINIKGELIKGVDAFHVVLKNEQKKPAEDQCLPLFTATSDDGEVLVIIPVEGKGLWGPIYGYISLKSDFNTIYGVCFDHKSETPGLGAEINTPAFEGQFRGKELYVDTSFISVQVIKGGAAPENIHGVDAISGGTITSKGLQNMLFDCLKKYNGYFTKNQN